MGGSFAKLLNPPVNVHEWQSLQREAVRIRMALAALVQESEKWGEIPHEHDQRYLSIKKQWQVIYPMLLQMIQSNRVRDLNDSLEWAKQIREEMDRLAERYLEVYAIKGKLDEKKEPLLRGEKVEFIP